MWSYAGIRRQLVGGKRIKEGSIMRRVLVERSRVVALTFSSLMIRTRNKMHSVKMVLIKLMIGILQDQDNVFNQGVPLLL